MEKMPEMTSRARKAVMVSARLGGSPMEWADITENGWKQKPLFVNECFSVEKFKETYEK